MKVVADSSPLIILAKIGCFDLLNRLYGRLYISTEVYTEVVINGAGLPGASEVAKSSWIESRPLQDHAALVKAQNKFSMGAGEIGTILLGKEIAADEVLLDDYQARQLAKSEGLRVRGTIGLLESFYRKGYLNDLRSSFRQLLHHSVYIDRRLLNRRLHSLRLPTL